MNTIRNINPVMHIFLAFFFIGIEIWARVGNLYSFVPNYDLISHFLYGFSMYFFLTFFFKHKSLSKYISIYVITALAWEFFEKIHDNVVLQPSYMLDVFFFDGVIDVLIGVVGVYLAYYLYPTRVRR